MADVRFDGQHVAEAGLIDDADVRVVAESPAELVDVAVEGVAVADFITSPYGYHQFGSINGLANTGCQFTQQAGLYVRYLHLFPIEYQHLVCSIISIVANPVYYIVNNTIRHIPQQRLDPYDQFPKFKGLFQIVVCSYAEAFFHIVNRALGSQEDDRHVA